MTRGREIMLHMYGSTQPWLFCTFILYFRICQRRSVNAVCAFFLPIRWIERCVLGWQNFARIFSLFPKKNRNLQNFASILWKKNYFSFFVYFFVSGVYTKINSTSLLTAELREKGGGGKLPGLLFSQMATREEKRLLGLFSWVWCGIRLFAHVRI